MDNMLLDEQVKLLFQRPCTFVKSVPHMKDLPPFSLPEIAFAGRSNVGKSSLINALLQQGALARTSNTPGRTQHLNFFNVAETFYLVDMPGYGYAEAPLALIKQWQKLIKDYLRGRPTLKRTYLLIDSRHGLKKNDLEMMKMLDETAASYQIILTKIDKISDTACDQHLQTIQKIIEKHPAAFPEIIATSSEKRKGIEHVRMAMGTLLFPA